MKFIDRVTELNSLVKERKEVPLDDLASILQVSPNYARDLKKEALRGGQVVEDQILFYKNDGTKDRLGARSLFETGYHKKLVEMNEGNMKKSANKQLARTEGKAGCITCYEEKIRSGMEEWNARQASQYPIHEMKVFNGSYLCAVHLAEAKHSPKELSEEAAK